MKLIIRSLTGSRTFIITLSLFAVANIWSWLRHRFDTACCDQEMTIGFPFPFHISGGIAGASGFYLLGLLLDIVVALTLALLLTRVAAFFADSRT